QHNLGLRRARRIDRCFKYSPIFRHGAGAIAVATRRQFEPANLVDSVSPQQIEGDKVVELTALPDDHGTLPGNASESARVSYALPNGGTRSQQKCQPQRTEADSRAAGVAFAEFQQKEE